MNDIIDSNSVYFKINNIEKILFYLFKKKLWKKKRKLNKNKVFKYLKILFLFNIYSEEYYFDSFLINFNLIKNLWIVFSNLYILKYINLKIQFINFFSLFYIKWKFFNILKLKKKKVKKSFLFFFFLRLKNFLKLRYFKLNHFNKILNKKLKINLSVNKIFKYTINKKIKIKNPLFIFNKYKKSIFFKLVRYYIRYFRLNIKKREFIFFWSRFYKYRLKKLYKYINYILKYLIYFIYKQYISLNKLINLKKIKNKFLFLFLFFNDSLNKKQFIRYCKVNSLYNNINKLVNSSFYKKKVFNLFIFNIKNNNIKNFFKEKINILKNKILIKFILCFKNFFLLFIFKFLIIWFNFFILSVLYYFSIRKTYFKKSLLDVTFIFNKIYNLKKINKVDIFINNNIFKWNYFFYKNIIK